MGIAQKLLIALQQILAPEGVPAAQKPVPLREEIEQKFPLRRTRIAHGQFRSARLQIRAGSVGNKFQMGIQGAEKLTGQRGVVKGQSLRIGRFHTHILFFRYASGLPSA